MFDTFHQQYIYERRVRRLVEEITSRLPRAARVLDVGCGDGLLASLLAMQRDDIIIEGIDVLVRPGSHIPVTSFDGTHIPFGANSFDVVTCIDVLHHTSDPMILLREFARVSPVVIIKDHLRNGVLAEATLRLMDFVGNARHGVNLPYNYWSRSEWNAAFSALGWSHDEWDEELRLYAPWLDWWFGRSLHYVARFTVAA
jgi:SAM-dependent methyltransferase